VDASVLVSAGTCLLLGLLLGAWLVRFRARRLSPARPVASGTPAADLPPGVVEVLGVLRSPTIVLNLAGDVLRASPSAIAFGLVRGRELVHAELRAMVVETRSLGLIRERELELPRGPLGPASLVLRIRVAPLGQRHLLMLVDDRTEARRVEEVRRDFVANVSHELKTPIGALHLLAEAVQDAADDPEAVRHFSTRMQRESMRLTSLVQEIIDLSRLQVADALHPPEPVDLEEVISEAVDRCRLGAGAKQIEVVIGGDHGAVVYGDHSLLVTAVRNLVDNAIAYSPEGTRVGVGVHRAAGMVEVRVSDQGMGIPTTEQERIFERFYRVDQARSRATGGTGLGLSIVKHVAANHGGEVSVWSVEGQGSTFTLRLPDSAAHSEPWPERPEPEAEPQAQPETEAEPDDRASADVPDAPRAMSP